MNYKLQLNPEAELCLGKLSPLNASTRPETGPGGVSRIPPKINSPESNSRNDQSHSRADSSKASLQSCCLRLTNYGQGPSSQGQGVIGGERAHSPFSRLPVYVLA